MSQAVSAVQGAVADASSKGEKSGRERRRDRRFAFRVPLVITRNGKELAARTEDVSFTGIFFRTDTPIPERQLVQLRLALPPGGDALSVMGMVARNVPARDGRPPGIGIQFYALAAGSRKRWIDFIRHVATAPRAVEAIPEAVAAIVLPPEPVRRQHPRYAAALQVLLHSVDDLQTFYTRNVSKGGLFVSTTLAIVEGTRLKVSVIHPRSHERFTLEAVVRRRITSGDPGLGLEFAELTEARREEFQEFISSELPIEELVYVAEGDRLLACSFPSDAAELIDLSELELASDG